jgi:hypothetical protein
MSILKHEHLPKTKNNLLFPKFFNRPFICSGSRGVSSVLTTAALCLLESVFLRFDALVMIPLNEPLQALASWPLSFQIQARHG